MMSVFYPGDVIIWSRDPSGHKALDERIYIEGSGVPVIWNSLPAFERWNDGEVRETAISLGYIGWLERDDVITVLSCQTIESKRVSLSGNGTAPRGCKLTCLTAILSAPVGYRNDQSYRDQIDSSVSAIIIPAPRLIEGDYTVIKAPKVEIR